MRKLSLHPPSGNPLKALSLDLIGKIWLLRHPTGNRYSASREGGEMTATVIIGIHGLANKPPRDEKMGWWKRALIEGLKRNCSKTTDELSFDFVYWADLRSSNKP
jgi:hypothetical protein